jgi:hypothetical protein
MYLPIVCNLDKYGLRITKGQGIFWSVLERSNLNRRASQNDFKTSAKKAEPFADPALIA